MPLYCTKCGYELEEGLKFCINCGTKIKVENPYIESPVPIKEAKKPGKSPSKKGSFTLFFIIGALLIALAIYSIVNELNDPQQTDSVSTNETTTVEETTSSSTEKLGENKDRTDSASTKEEDGAFTEVASDSKEDSLGPYEKELNQLTIGELSVGKWEITQDPGKIHITAHNIPIKDLENIFTMYDRGNLDPFITWAKEVTFIAEELSNKFNKLWEIEVGNDCTVAYPKTLPSSDIINYSGSCGYSIPILTGSTKDNLALFINESVFAEQKPKANIDVEAAVKEIREEYYSINDHIDQYQPDESEGNIKKYKNKRGVIKKMIKYEPATGLTTEYYFWDNKQVFFIFTTNESKEENRYYFKDQQMIRWIDEHKQTLEVDDRGHNEEYARLESYWMNEVAGIQ